MLKPYTVAVNYREGLVLKPPWAPWGFVKNHSTSLFMKKLSMNLRWLSIGLTCWKHFEIRLSRGLKPGAVG